MKFLEIPLVARTRQHHGIEHATIHILADRDSSLRLVGRSDPAGFYVYGNLETDALISAVDEALERLRTEPELAVHPNCGTNLVTAGMMAGAAAWLATTSTRRRHPLDQAPFALLAATAALFFAQPIGYSIQERITTSPDVRGITVKRINRSQVGNLTVHRVDFDHAR